MKNTYYKTLVLFTLMFTKLPTMLGQGAYINLQSGYAIGASKQNLNAFNMMNLHDDGRSVTMQQLDISFGKGFSYAGAVGYMFNKSIGAELGFSSLLGDNIRSEQTDINTKLVYLVSSKLFRLNPSIVIASQNKGLTTYAKLGIVIGSGYIMYENNETYKSNNTVLKMKFYGGTPLGLSSAVGLNVKLNKKINMFGELNIMNMSYAPAKGTMTEATFNGQDILSQLPVSDKEINFVNSLTADYTKPASESEPRKELSQKLPFGSVGMNVGIRMNL